MCSSTVIKLIEFPARGHYDVLITEVFHNLPDSLQIASGPDLTQQHIYEGAYLEYRSFRAKYDKRYFMPDIGPDMFIEPAL